MRYVVCNNKVKFTALPGINDECIPHLYIGYFLAVTYIVG